MIAHRGRIEDLMDEHETANHLANGCPLMSVNNAAVLDLARVQAQEIVVVGENDPTAAASTSEFFFVGSAEHARLFGRENVHSSKS